MHNFLLDDYGTVDDFKHVDLSLVERANIEFSQEDIQKAIEKSREASERADKYLLEHNLI